MDHYETSTIIESVPCKKSLEEKNGKEFMNYIQIVGECE